MTTAGQWAVAPIVAKVADALADVRAMLLAAEAHASFDFQNCPSPQSPAQGFDLSLQILDDIERLARQMADRLPPGLAIPLQPETLLLERTRSWFAPPGTAPLTETSPLRRVDLFQS